MLIAQAIEERLGSIVILHMLMLSEGAAIFQENMQTSSLPWVMLPGRHGVGHIKPWACPLQRGLRAGGSGSWQRRQPSLWCSQCLSPSEWMR